MYYLQGGLSDIGVGERFGNLLQAVWMYSKLGDVGGSCKEVVETYKDLQLSTTAKTVKYTAEGAFILSRMGEITERTYDHKTKAVLNTYATLSDMTRKIVDGVIKEENVSSTLIKVGASAISGFAECATNAALAAKNERLALI